MPREMKTINRQTTPSTFLALMAGWVQQGVESFFATQRVLVDVAMQQNAIAMKSLRDGLSDPEHSPMAIFTELAVEGTSSFMEAQRILLNLAKQENELFLNGLKERVGGWTPAVAMTDMTRRSIDTFIAMQQDFLKMTSKQTISWLEEVKHGKGYNSTHMVEMAREGMENFVAAQKKFLDIIAQETARATSGKPHESKVKPMELSKLAREATNAFIEAQKKLLDVVGQQMTVNLKSATKTMELLSPARLLPMASFTGEGVKNFVNAEKELINSVVKGRNGIKHAPKRKHAARRKPKMARMAHAGA